MQSIRSMQRKRNIHKIQSTVGTRKGRRGRNLALRPDEPAAVHELMAEDAQPNLRVWQMYEEAEEFEDSLLSFKELLVNFEKATDEFLLRLEPIMRAPLPRVWDAVEGGLAEPTRATISHAHQHTVGGDISIAGLEESRSHFHNQIRGHVIRPLDQWREALDVVEKERLPALKNLRKRVLKHSRSVGRYSARYQRQVAESGGGTSGALIPVSGGVQKPGGVKGLFGACTRPRSNTPSRMPRDEYSSASESDTESDVARMVASEDAGMRLNYKHRKLDAARGDYFEAERVVAEQLEGLCRDGAWLKSYMVAALLLNKEAMQMSVVSMGNTKQPLPGFTSRYAGRVEHGVLRDNVDLVAMMPPELKRRPPMGMSGSGIHPSERTSLLPESGLHAHKGTASPMELSARPDSHALEWVRPTPTGASAVPLEAVQRAGLGIEGRDQGAAALPAAAAGGGSSGRYLEYDVGGSGVRRKTSAQRPALGGREDEGVTRDRDYYAGDESSRLAGVTPEPAGRGGRVWGSGGVSTGGDLRSGVQTRPAERQIDEQDREGLRDRGRGVMGAIASAVEGAAETVAHAVGLGGHNREEQTARDSARVSDSSAAGFRADNRDRVDISSPRDVSGYSDRVGVRDQGLGSGVREDLSPEVCGRREFTVVEDRPIVKERVTKIMEHRPVEKKFETALKYVGEQAMPGSVEAQGDTTRVISTTPARPEPEIRDRREFTEVEDRPIVKERVTKYQESRPVEKQYETTLKFAGENHQAGNTEHLSEDTRVVSATQPEPEPEIRDRHEWTEVEDRPQVKERVTRLQENHPVEKRYETALKYVGEESLPGSAEPLAGPEERIVSEAAPGSKCPGGECEREPVLAA